MVDDDVSEVSDVSRGAALLQFLRRTGDWILRRRVPLVLFPLMLGLIFAAAKGVELLFEEPERAVAEPDPVLCWDNEIRNGVAACGLPEGAKGLKWVFPSFAPARSNCRDLKIERPDLPRPTMWECERVLRGENVRILYSQLASVSSSVKFYDKQFPDVTREEITDRNGELTMYRWLTRDQGDSLAVVVYSDYPFGVEIRAETSKVRSTALRKQVKFRAADRVVTRPGTPEALPE